MNLNDQPVDERVVVSSVSPRAMTSELSSPSLQPKIYSFGGGGGKSEPEVGLIAPSFFFSMVLFIDNDSPTTYCAPPP